MIPIKWQRTSVARSRRLAKRDHRQIFVICDVESSNASFASSAQVFFDLCPISSFPSVLVLQNIFVFYLLPTKTAINNRPESTASTPGPRILLGLLANSNTSSTFSPISDFSWLHADYQRVKRGSSVAEVAKTVGNGGLLWKAERPADFRYH